MAEGQGLAPDTPVSGPTGSAATPVDISGATPAAAPTIQVGDKAYTMDEVQTHLANYQQLQGNYTRASQELSRARDAVEFANVLERHPDLRDQFVAQIEQRVKGVPPQSATPGKEQDPEVAAIKRELEGLKNERAMEWARGQWSNMRSKFEGIMGRQPTQQEEIQVQRYLDSTGAADLWSATLAVFERPIMDRAAILREQRAQQAEMSARGNVTEGTGTMAAEGPIDWAQADLDAQVAKARKIAGGESDPTYNPYVDFGTQR